MSLPSIVDNIPEELSGQLLNGENVYYFSWITTSKKKPERGSTYWIALTDKRALYKAKVKDPSDKSKFIERDGTLPLNKVSFVEVKEQSETQGCGCRNVKVYSLEVGTSGGTVQIPMPSKDKCHEVRRVYAEICDQ